MDVLNVGGKEYVKASVIARDLGYTADYVGQLCRSHRVHAKLVGRSWYVDRDSISMHKTSRYRSTTTKAKESLREEVKVRVNESTNKQVASPHFYHSQKTSKVAYLEDESELIPLVQKEGKRNGSLEVELADAVQLPIASSVPSYRMDAPKLPEIRFRGALHVSEVDEGRIQEMEGQKIIHPKEVKDHKKTKNIVISSKPFHGMRKTTALIPQNAAHRNGATTATTKNIHSHDLPVHTPVRHESAQTPAGLSEGAKVLVAEEGNSSLGSKVLVLASFAFSILLVVGLLGLESNYLVEGQTVTTSYQFAIEHLTASVHTSVEEFDALFDLLKFSTNFFIF